MIIPTFLGRAIVSPKATTKNEITIWEPKNIPSSVPLLAIANYHTERVIPGRERVVGSGVQENAGRRGIAQATDIRLSWAEDGTVKYSFLIFLPHFFLCLSFLPRLPSGVRSKIPKQGETLMCLLDLGTWSSPQTWLGPFLSIQNGDAPERVLTCRPIRWALVWRRTRAYSIVEELNSPLNYSSRVRFIQNLKSQQKDRLNPYYEINHIHLGEGYVNQNENDIE